MFLRQINLNILRRKFQSKRSFLNLPIIKIREDALELKKRKEKEREEKGENVKNENEVNESETEKNVIFGIRVLVLISLITSISNNNRLFKQCGDDGDKIQQIETEMDEITSKICHEEFRQNVLNELEKGDKDALKKSIAKLLENYDDKLDKIKNIEDSNSIN